MTASREDAVFDGRIPKWDGTSSGLPSFEKEVRWWLAGGNVEALDKTNVAVRLISRQKGAAKNFGKTFDPGELANIPKRKNPDGSLAQERDLRRGSDQVLEGFRTLVGTATG